MTVTFEPVSPALAISDDDALRQLAKGLPVVVSDLASGQGFLVLAADRASTTAVAFAVRHSSGFLHIALPRARCENLQLPPMNPFQEKGTRMCVGVDAAGGTGTGISAADRASTARTLMDPAAMPDDFTRPGHLVPVCVDEDTDDDRSPSPASIALDLTRRAGCAPGALFAELVGLTDPTAMITHPECQIFADTHSLVLITVP